MPDQNTPKGVIYLPCFMRDSSYTHVILPRVPASHVEARKVVNIAATAAVSSTAAPIPSVGPLEPPHERESRLVGVLQLEQTLLLAQQFERDPRRASNFSRWKKLCRCRARP